MDEAQPSTPREVRIDAQIHAGEIQGGEVSAVRIEHAHGAIITGYSVEEVSRLVDQIRQNFTPRPFSGKSPYLGLETFQEGDAGRFFGRDRLVAEILERLSSSRCIALAGPSGSGKSSLVRAGLLPALKGKHPRQTTPIPESPGWLYAALRPGRQPLEALGRAVSSLTGGLQPLEDLRTKGLAGGSLLADWLETALGDDPRRRVVLLVDQFEEIFTQLPSQAEPLRAAFLDLLVQAASRPEGRTILMLTLRSDFIASCAAYPALNALLNAGFLQIGAMSARELAEAIARPAVEAGLIIEDELCRRIMNEMRDQPGGLPLMQFALHDLFTARQASGGLVRLTLDDYLARGGLGQALERYANQAFSQLNQKEQQLARWIFSGLVQPGRGAQDTARRDRGADPQAG
jgi:energy-coupling factor transporter ATP-binding protein EcfA2